MFAGVGEQSVRFDRADASSTFVCVQNLKNGQGCLDFNTRIHILYLINSFTVEGSNVRIGNLTTNNNAFIVNGNLTITGSSTVKNLHVVRHEQQEDGNLTITGSLNTYAESHIEADGDVVAAGFVTINTGTLFEAHGKYRVQSFSSGEYVATNGYTKLLDGANLIVEGDFWTQSTYNYPFFNGASTLTLYGDFHQVGASTYFYRASEGAGSSKTVFAGDGAQSVSFDRSDASSTFVVVSQLLPTCLIKLESSIYYIYAATDLNIVADSHTIGNLSVNGKAVHFVSDDLCSAAVTFSVSVSLGGGNILCDDDLTLSGSSCLNVNNGSVIVEGDLILNSSSYVTLNGSENAYGMLFVYGNMLNHSTHDISLSRGILDIKGDYLQYEATTVNSTNDVVVQFTGSYSQVIYFPSGANVHFNVMAFAQVTSNNSGVLSPNLNYYIISSTPIWNTVIEKIDSFILSQLIIAGSFGQAGTNLATGNYSQTVEDISFISAIGQVKISHTYNSLSGADGILGKNFSLSHNMKLTFSENNGINYASAVLPGGVVKTFVQNVDGTFTASNARATLVSTEVNDQTQYTVSDPTNTKVVFDENGFIKYIEDSKGNKLSFETDSVTGNITQIHDITGLYVDFSYNNGKLASITDNSVQQSPVTCSFTYDSDDRLVSSTNMNGITLNYEYKEVEEGEDPSSLLSAFKNGNNQTIESVEYIDNFGIVSSVTNARGLVFAYSYGDERHFYSSITDTNGRTTGQSYDGSRNITSSHNAAAEVSQFTYLLDENGINRYSEIATQTDERGNTTSYTRDANGNVTLITYPNNSTESFVYDTNNNVIKHTDRDGKTTYYVYNGFLLMEMAVRLSGNADYTSNDRNNRDFAVTTYTYYQTSNIVKINGLVHTETSPSGAVTTYEYDVRGRVTKKTYGTGNGAYYISYTYDSRGNVLTETDSDGVATSYTYNADGFLTQKDIASGNETRVLEKYLYDSLGRKVQEQNGQQYYSSSSTRYTYNTAGDVMSKILYINSTTQYSTLYEYDAYGNVTKETLPNGSYYTYTYDVLNRNLNTSFYDNTTQQTKLLQSVSYTNSGTNLEVTTLDYTGETATATTVEIRNFENNIISKTIKNGNNIYASYSYTYTPGGKLYTETDPNGNVTTYEYDALGNVAEIAAPFDDTYYTHTYRTYDKSGNMTQELVQNNLPGETETTVRTDYSYDVWGNLTAEIMYEGNSVISVSRYVYNNKNRLICEYRGLTSINQEVSTNYSMTSGRANLDYAMTTYVYNGFGELTSSIDPMGHSESYSYFNYGEVHTYSDKNGSTTTYTYNNLGKVASETVTKTGQTTITKSFQYDCMGNLTALTEGSTTITYTYDGLGNILTETSGNIVKNYTYDRAGNVLSAAVTDGDVLTENFQYAYDFLGRLHQVKDGNTVKATYTYDNMSRLTVTTYPGNVTETTTYNAAGLPVSVTNAHGNDIISEFEYEYYLNGNQYSKTDESGTTYYLYNDRGYLTRTTYPDASYDAYAYDACGNRTEKLSVSPELVNDYTSYEYDNNNRLTEKQSTVPDHNTGSVLDLLQSINIGGTTYYVTEYEYDNNGNMTSSKYEEDTDDEYIITQTFDLLDRMVSYESPDTEAEYNYYPDNKRESKTVTNIMITQAGQGMLQGMGNQPMSGGGSGLNPNPINPTPVVTTHIWLGDEIAFDITSSDVVKYLHGMRLIESDYGLYLYDAHGNVTEILDSDYDVCNSYTYDPFGDSILSVAESIIRDTDMESLNPPVGMQSFGGGQFQSGMIINHAPENPYRYCGEYTDLETGYVYLRARYYDPNLGRFISEDSAKDGYNWYVYCGNDPVNRVDPSGLSFFSDAVDYWYEGISVLQHSGTAGQIFASYSLGVMNTISGQINGICNFFSNLPGSIVNGWNTFLQNPLVNNPITQTIIGVYNFYSGLAKASYNEDWNSVAYSLGGATVIAGEMAVAYEISSTIRDRKLSKQISEQNTTKGWRVGDPVDNLTESGNEPSWSTIRQRHWKNKAFYNSSNYNQANLQRMQKGLAPLVKYKNGKWYPMELHHPHGRIGRNIYDFIEVTPWKHAKVDPFRHWKP